MSSYRLHVPLGDNTFGVSVWWILTIQKETKQMRSFTLLPSPSPSPFPLPWGKTISILNDAICAHESLSRQVLVFVYCSFCCVTRVIVCICAYVCLCMSVCVCVCWYALVCAGLTPICSQYHQPPIHSPTHSPPPVHICSQLSGLSTRNHLTIPLCPGCSEYWS